MKFPISMLRDFVDTQLSTDAIGDLLTMAGFELEGIDEVEGEAVLDIKVMSNRGDGLSVFGLAREILAKDSHSAATDLYRGAVDRFASAVSLTGTPDTSVNIETEDCTRYACLILSNVTRADSEPWMQARLRRAGMRPISLLVDVTNYVMLEVGQPLHAFDFDKLAERRIVVRKARDGEKLTTLNGDEHELRSDQMMICDAHKPVGVAGVMGGLDTEVSETTTSVLLESAHFVNTSVRRTRKQLGLNTEASYRFERSVDPEGVVAALLRCAQLVIAADPGARASEVVDQYPIKPQPAAIRLRVCRASKLLGMPITTDEAESYLTRLGFKPEKIGEDTFQVMTPSWRPDIVREEDLIEELGRVHGYDRIPETVLHGATTRGGPQGFELWTDWLREAALKAGFSQTISHSLCDTHPLEEPGAHRIGPRTPASPEMAYLRSSLLTSLSDAARRNNPKEVHLFEIGHVFAADGAARYRENIRIAFLSAGPLIQAGWSISEGAASNFFTLKGALEAALGAVGVSISLMADSIDPRLHPTQQAQIYAGGSAFGIIGRLHPDAAKACGLSTETVVAEVDLQCAFACRDTGLELRSVSRHPSVRRDMSILIDKAIRYEDVAERIQAAGGSVLERQWLFDVFAGSGIPEGKHALGIAIQLRKPDSTFTDEEANQVRDRVVAALAEFGASTR